MTVFKRYGIIIVNEVSKEYLLEIKEESALEESVSIFIVGI